MIGDRLRRRPPDRDRAIDMACARPEFGGPRAKEALPLVGACDTRSTCATLLEDARRLSGEPFSALDAGTAPPMQELVGIVERAYSVVG